MRRVVSTLVTAGLLFLGTTSSAAAQAQTTEQRLRANRDELEKIRRERDDLQRRLNELQGEARDITAEVSNLRRQADATARLVRSLDAQLTTITVEVDSTNARLTRAEQDVSRKRTALQQRVIDIYKRGPLYTVEALLSARSFGELVGRYKYLHELALWDRSLVNRVETLYRQVAQQRQLLVRLRDEFERNREEKAREENRLRQLERFQSRTLVNVQRTQQDVQRRLANVARDEQRLSNLIASLEEARRKAAAEDPSDAAPSTSTIKASDAGKLDWPVSGGILYRFGRLVSPDNTAVRWNGIGIEAASGAPVRAIAAGQVMLSETLGTYGLTIIIQHGGGDYSVYGSLSISNVRKGMEVIKGQVIGAVGRADPDMEPHLHFEFRPKGRAVDPLNWLKGQ
ncbi:MAG: murein hydrolase activator EnvC family protein [Gemmatimonadaceae bacterium]